MNVKDCKLCIKIIVLALICCVYNTNAAEYLVRDQAEYKNVSKKLKAGDTVILANGTWYDFDILFKGIGTARALITLTAQDKGKVILSGESSLRLAGKYLLVQGLVFKDGYTPKESVIAFRQNKDNLAYRSRVTEVVIDNYNNPERYENDNWVTIYGKRNRFDHNFISGKRNKGVTVAVKLNTKKSQNNYHLIDHNYFGPRPILGANGGETLRIGTSHYSLTNSRTTVEYNYFDRCNGELEVISNKSGKNVFRGNVFYESRGTLTMRHGNDTLVEDNVFFGNNKPYTGGIRVINERQTVRNNYMEGLKGYRFGGAFVVMNGVPNSPINRYFQVNGGKIENNSILYADHIQWAAGSDKERSAVPINTTFKNNLIVNGDYNAKGKDNFTIYDDLSGITFINNYLHNIEQLPIKTGFTSQNIQLARADNGLLYPTDAKLAKIGVSKKLNPIQKTATGPNWYSKPQSLVQLATGNPIDVEATENGLYQAIKKAKAGDILRVASGQYTIDRTLIIDKPLTIIAKDLDTASSTNTVQITFERSTLFQINDGGSLYLQGVDISGEKAPDVSNNAVIRLQRSAMLHNYQIFLDKVAVSNLTVNHSFNVIDVSKGTFADNIDIKNSTFDNISGTILNLNKEIDDDGIYNAEYVNITNSKFSNVQGAIVNFYRGGRDESTFGPHFVMTGSTVLNVGFGKRNKVKSSIFLHGVQVTQVKNNQFSDSAPISLEHTVGEPRSQIVDNILQNTAKPMVAELYSTKANTAVIHNNTYIQK